MSSPRWDSYFMKMAALVATKSKDRSTKVGCVIVGPDNEVRATGYNGFPRRVKDDESARHERPVKYLFTEHAERNACFAAAKVGIPVNGCRMYVTMWPCADCSRAIIQSGISELIAPEPDFELPQWKDSFMAGVEMMHEAGVYSRFFAEEC